MIRKVSKSGRDYALEYLLKEKMAMIARRIAPTLLISSEWHSKDVEFQDTPISGTSHLQADSELLKISRKKMLKQKWKP